MTMVKIADLLEQLRSGCHGVTALAERSLERASDPWGEGGRAFVALHAEAARRAAHSIDSASHDFLGLPLAGVPISVKDNFDEANVLTRAGSLVFEGQPPARVDSIAIQRARAAGAVVCGRTNMVEVAFGAHGLNSHFGTPRNPFDRGFPRIPGGSSSGAAVSVADGMVAAALGTDTAGSCRIPAALCGVVGFKPTAASVPAAGIMPLAPSLDAVGLLAPSVDCARRVHEVLSKTSSPEARGRVDSPRLLAPSAVVLELLDDEIGAAFESSTRRLVDAGARVKGTPGTSIAGAIELAAELIPGEAYRQHARHLRDFGSRFDPFVRRRLERGQAISDQDLEQLRAEHARLRPSMDRDLEEHDALLMPTVPCVAPTIASIDGADGLLALNGRLLRNTVSANVFDLPAITLPCQAPGDAPAGLMLVGRRGADGALLALASWVEGVLEAR